MASKDVKNVEKVMLLTKLSMVSLLVLKLQILKSMMVVDTEVYLDNVLFVNTDTTTIMVYVKKVVPTVEAQYK